MRNLTFYLILLISLALLAGCEISPIYTGDCVIEKVNGKVGVVTVWMPFSNTGQRPSLKIQNRDEMEKLIEGLEGLLVDLKNARDEMPIIEPALELSQ